MPAITRYFAYVVTCLLAFLIFGSLVYAEGTNGDGTLRDGSDATLPDLFSGVSSYKFQIELPSGRNGMTPELSLSYRSNNGNGWTGVGWDMEIGAIERSSKSE
ncbi:MAG: SpvB/TcaC N-terminal domain-containing protein [Geobacteraceae bacterium]